MEKQLQHITELLAQILRQDLPENLETINRRRVEIVIRTQMGQSQTEICSALGCSKDTARHWMTIAKTQGFSNWYEHSIGRPKKVDDHYMQRLQDLVKSNPKEYGYSFSRWTARLLSKHLAQELGIEISDRHVNRLLKQMGLSTRNPHQSGETAKSAQYEKSTRIKIDDLNPAFRSQLDNSPW